MVRPEVMIATDGQYLKWLYSNQGHIIIVCELRYSRGSVGIFDYHLGVYPGLDSAGTYNHVLALGHVCYEAEV